MKTLWKVSLLLCLVLSLSACAPQGGPSDQGSGSISQQPPASSQGDVSAPDPGEEEPQSPDKSQEESLPLTADYAPEELLEREGDYDYFEADGGEWQVKLVISARETVTDLSYVTLNLDYYDEDGELAWGVGDTLYTQEELTPQRPLVVGMVFYGDVANRGLTFVDSQGNFRCVSINMSGTDGSILLVEEALDRPE